MKQAHNFKDRLGDVQGLLTVIGRDPKNLGTRAQWICKCACGRVVSLTLRKQKSCGKCAFDKKYPSEYISWECMNSRCNNPYDRAFPNYGGRGIKITNRWITFAYFLEDMKPKPNPNYTLERIDVNGDYCKENCVWVPRNEQPKNTRRSFINRL